MKTSSHHLSLESNKDYLPNPIIGQDSLISQIQGLQLFFNLNEKLTLLFLSDSLEEIFFFLKTS